MIAVIQARMSSTRLPGKVLMPLGEKPVLSWVVDAARQANFVSDVVVATSSDESDDLIEEHCVHTNIDVVRGPLDDVLARYLAVADVYGAEALMRLTADCPLLDPRVLDAVVTVFEHPGNGLSYASNTIERTLPRGLDCEVVNVASLREISIDASAEEKEHVTLGVLRRPEQFRQRNVAFEPDSSDLRVTIDTHEDLLAVSRIVDALGARATERSELVGYLRSHPETVQINQGVHQREVGN